jgi:methylglutaconyl-CoA hydratase
VLRFETIALEVSPRSIATVLLNRPERRNAFNRLMLSELAAVLDEIAADRAVRVMVLRSQGRHFCAGADLAEREPGEPDRPAGPTLLDVLASLDNLPKPTIAVVGGGAIGGGAAFVACCDIALATDAAFFSIPEVRVGMAPVRLAPLFIRAVGYRGFRRYGLTGERMTAVEALRLGLVHQLCAAQSLDSAVAEVADALLHGAPGAMAELKAATSRLAAPPWPAADARIGQGLPKTSEAIEGIASFRDKRKPSWYPK